MSPEQLANYISGFTTGVIGASQEVRVQFAQPIVSPEQVDQSGTDGWLDFSPATPGVFHWDNVRTLVFSPEEGWEPGQTYTVTVDLKAAYDTLTGPDSYVFEFTVREPNVQVEVVGMYTPDPQRMAEPAIGGIVRANDPVDVGRLEGLIAASQNGRSLPVDYVSTGDMTFEFVVGGVQRGEEATSVQLNWDAESLKLGNASGSREMDIPGLGDFKVMNVRYDNSGSANVEVRFSDPLQATQDLTGLLTVEGVNQLRFQVVGNVIKAYVEGGLSGNKEVAINAAVQNMTGRSLGRDVKWQVSFTRPEPELRAVGDGVIIPHDGPRLFPFEAIGLESVVVEIFKIYENNVLQFLQENQLQNTSDDYSLQRVGRIISQDRVVLKNLVAESDLDNWTRYALDLNEYLDEDPEAIYQVRIGFGLNDVRRNCGTKLADYGLKPMEFNKEVADVEVGFSDPPSSYLGSYYGVYGYYDDHEWEDRDDVCKPAFYHRERFLLRNVLSSNIGIIAKQDEDRGTVVIATDLLSGRPLSGATVSLYDQQQQALFSGNTDASGFVKATTDFRPAFVTVSKNSDVGYLKLDWETALGLSRFDVSGVSATAGLKGVFYADRGVWRPGDSVFLNFVIEDRLAKLPDNYPVNFELYDARGRLLEERTVTPGAGNIYPLHLVTDRDDPTGNWRAVVKAGGQEYQRSLKIETVKPNRLSIDLNFGDQPLSSVNRSVRVKSSWLHGAPAAGLTADVEMQLRPRYDGFEDWPAYVFHDPARRSFDDSPNVVFDAALNGRGEASFSIPALNERLPGKMRAGFKTRVYEPGGNFSVDNIQTDYLPYPYLVGVRLPENRWGGQELPIGQASTVELAVVDPEGRPAAGRQLQVGLYEVRWRYWWQDNNDNVSRFNSNDHREAVETYTVTTNGSGKVNLPVTVNQWGRYLLRACDGDGHCTGDYFYAGSPADGEGDREAAALLPLQIDREEYKVGESVEVSIPATSGGMILVSLENSTGVLSTKWVEATAGNNVYRFTADESMMPNLYVNVQLIQPHSRTEDDRPLRMYGVIPVKVIDPDTRLEPQVVASDEWEPEEEVTVAVSEKNGRAMSYTLAVVDEGLLGLTRFATPDLWTSFFAREALSVRTFDLFQQVIGAQGADFSRVLAIGGDGELEPGVNEPRANRFEPVVRHLGPFELPAGRKATHRINLPNYVGAVRLMVVAAGDRAYGKAEKTIPVRKPLMILPTLPRVLAPGEEIAMPVNVFAMSDKVKNARVTVRELTGGMVDFKVSNAQEISFAGPGDQLLRFPFTVGDRLGVARFEVVAEGSGERITQTMEIDIRNPNAFQTETKSITIPPGESREVAYAPFGMNATRTATFEAATLPPLNLSRHLKYLLRYPYGCLEQTVSPAFAQLHLANLVELSNEEEESTRRNVMAGLNQLLRFQTSDGALSYWPGQGRAHPWATNYALHFILEAEAAGYTVPNQMKSKLIDFQRSAAGNWRNTVFDYYVSDRQRYLDQAYRLYTLALAGRADLGAMNRLKGVKDLATTAAFRLAAAYSLAGKQSTAEDILNGRDGVISPYRELSYTFGSQIRDLAMILETNVLMGRSDAAGRVAMRLAEAVSKRRWLSTQEAAFAMVSLAKLVENEGVGDDLQLRYVSPTGSSSDLGSNLALLQVELPSDADNSSFSVTNLGTSTIFASVVTSGQPLPGEEKSVESNLDMSVSYADMNGNAVNPANLRAGTDFVATYEIIHPATTGLDYREMALKSVIAGGWEIVNERMDLIDDGAQDAAYTYRDYRDAEVMTFFDLDRSRTKRFSIRLTAAYPGRYYLPTQLAEAMYDNDIQAAVKGQWISVLPLEAVQ